MVRGVSVFDGDRRRSLGARGNFGAQIMSDETRVAATTALEAWRLDPTARKAGDLVDSLKEHLYSEMRIRGVSFVHKVEEIPPRKRRGEEGGLGTVRERSPLPRPGSVVGP